MKKLLQLFRSPISLFFYISSIYIAVLLLNDLFIFDWIRQLFLVLKPFWIGIVIAFFMQPLITKNQKRVPIQKVIFIYFILLFSFLALFLILFYLLISNTRNILELFDNIYPKLELFINRNRISNTINMTQIKDILLNGYTWFMPFIESFIGFITTFVFAVMISFFISLESHIVYNELKKYVKNYEQIFNLYDIFFNILRQYIYSTLLDVLYIVVTTTLILFIFKTPYALLLAILLALFNLFPYIGALMGSVLLVFIHFLLVKNNTLWLIAIIFINSQIESNIVHAWICNKTMKVHPLFLFLAILIGEYIFGIMGVILSPIVASILQLALTTYREYLNQKNVGGWENIVS